MGGVRRAFENEGWEGIFSMDVEVRWEIGVS